MYIYIYIYIYIYVDILCMLNAYYKDRHLLSYMTYVSCRNVLFMKTAPHEMLFPRCSVLVHHGGSGTTMAALRSGIPSVVTGAVLGVKAVLFEIFCKRIDRPV